MLGSIGQRPTADWTVLTLERDDAELADARRAVIGDGAGGAMVEDPELGEGEFFAERLATPSGAPRARRPLRVVEAPTFADAASAEPDPARAAPRARRRVAQPAEQPFRGARPVDDADRVAFAAPDRAAQSSHEAVAAHGGAAHTTAIADGRRTVVIRGHVAERQVSLPATNQRRRPARRPSDRVAQRPDRVALWAFGLALLLILVAVLSAAGA